MNSINIIRSYRDGIPAPVFQMYPNQTQPQQAILQWDGEYNILSAGYNPEIGSSVPSRVFYGICIRWQISPYLSIKGVDTLIDTILPFLELLKKEKEFYVEWGGSNPIGKLTNRGLRIVNLIHFLIEYSDFDTVDVMDAVDYIDPGLSLTTEIKGDDDIDDFITGLEKQAWDDDHIYLINSANLRDYLQRVFEGVI